MLTQKESKDHEFERGTWEKLRDKRESGKEVTVF